LSYLGELAFEDELLEVVFFAGDFFFVATAISLIFIIKDYKSNKLLLIRICFMKFQFLEFKNKISNQSSFCN
jgi:hypothetical protein